MTPMVDVEVIGSRGPVAVTAILDTGFDGDLCLPTRLAVALGLELIDRDLVELADGTPKVGTGVLRVRSVLGQDSEGLHLPDGQRGRPSRD